MKRIIIGNWKMNPATIAEAKTLARKVRTVAAGLVHTETVVCPPVVFLSAVASRASVSNFHIGAQTVSEHDSGAHTGEVSASMLCDMGAEYVIAGHSEERAAGVTDELVSRRVAAIVSHGMTAVVCVGENERDEEGAYLEKLKEQIRGSFAGVPANKAKHIVIAYEPVWAIGAKEAMLPEQIYETSLFIKKVFSDIFGPEEGLKLRVLYGGSVNSRNAEEIVRIGKVDGLLVGRESVNAPGFSDLLRIVDKLS